MSKILFFILDAWSLNILSYKY